MSCRAWEGNSFVDRVEKLVAKCNELRRGWGEGVGAGGMEAGREEGREEGWEEGREGRSRRGGRRDEGEGSTSWGEGCNALRSHAFAPTQ